MEDYQTLGLTNQFKSPAGDHEINFRNDTKARTDVTSIEILRRPSNVVTAFPAKAEDNVAMALAILGVGRVTDDVEHQAQQRALMIEDHNYGHTSDGVLVQAIIGLRAILIAQKHEEEVASKDIEDAYALYKLAYPKSSITRERFPEMSTSEHWISTLRKVRQDPTKLGAL